jgi:hypothetical protein
MYEMFDMIDGPPFRAVRRGDSFSRTLAILMPIAVAVISVVGLACSGSAEPLNPDAYTSLGSLEVSSGNLTFNTDTLTVSGEFSLTGVVQAQSTGLPSIAVFDFSKIAISNGVTVNFVGSRPVALLSRGDLTISPTLTLNGGVGANATLVFGQCDNTSSGAGGSGGVGGGRGGSGGTADTSCSGPTSDFHATSGRNGFGPGGGSGGLPSGPGGSGTFHLPDGGVSIAHGLFGGSGGGGAGGSDEGTDSFGAGGGGGGGALELSAKGAVTLGAVRADGAAGGRGTGGSKDAGTGSGGGILVAGATVTAAELSAASVFLAPASYTLGSALPSIRAGQPELVPGNTIIPFGSTLSLVNGKGLLPSGFVLQPVDLTVNGMLTADGKIAGSLINAGTVTPGHAVGSFEVGRDFQQSPSGILGMQIDGTNPGVSYDQLLVDGNALLGGTLVIDFLNGLLPTVGQTFDLIRFASHTGEFASLDVKDLGNGLFLKQTYSDHGLRLTVCDNASCGAP